jgi:hypothetical protein
MTFHLPQSSKSLAVMLTLIVLLIGIAWGTYDNPELLWAPGPLSSYHAAIKNCNVCHTSFRGPTADKCSACHSPEQFARDSTPTVTGFHLSLSKEQKICNICHIEHQGGLSPIIRGTINNPHGEFVFRAVDVSTCKDCHQFKDIQRTPILLNNSTVKHLLEEGHGMHQLGRMADCLGCHRRE